jgi:hypothetical protein
MITIKTLSNQGEAAFLHSLLQGNGFDAVLLDEGAFHYSMAFTPIRLQVPEDQASAAITFLSAAPELQPGFTPTDTDSDDDGRRPRST